MHTLCSNFTSYTFKVIEIFLDIIRFYLLETKVVNLLVYYETNELLFKHVSRLKTNPVK